MTSASQILAKAPWKRQAKTMTNEPKSICTPALPTIAKFAWEEDIQGDCTPNVKNTFITLEYLPKSAPARRKSVPAATRLCREAGTGVKFLVASLDSDASTDAQTEASTCSECGVQTPMSMDNYCFEEPSAESCWWPQEVCPENLWHMPPSSLTHSTSALEPSRLNSKAASFQPHSLTQELTLNAKAAAFQPQSLPQEPSIEDLLHKQPIADVISQAKEHMQASESIGSVKICEDASGWSIVIKPSVDIDSDEWQTEALLTIAKDCLLQAALSTKNIFVMGYCSPNAFPMRAQGFEASLGVMQAPSQACWHVFKKGFCRHAGDCSKQHPAIEVPVRVLVESAQFNSCTGFVSSFKQEVADVTMAVMATLTECAFADKVEAVKDSHAQGWTIEVMPNETSKPDQEYLLALAKNALFSATSNSNSVYIMGYSAKPFVSTSDGFVGVLGDMQDETRVCWDLYCKGVCSRGCDCRHAHPECLVPIKVVVKERPPVDCLESVLDYFNEFPAARKGC